MTLLSDFKASGRAPITKSQSQIGQWTRSLLRKKPYSTPQFDVALPYEIWSVILWIVLDRIIDPLAYCDSDTYPTLCYRLDDAQGRHFQDWFQLRLVCRMWNSILGNCPHIVCSVDKSIPAEHRLARVTSMRCIPYGVYGEKMTNLERYPQLTSKLTMLAFSTYLHWSDQKFTHECITFNNVTCLYLGWLEVPAGRPDFWPSFSASFPRLIWLTVRGSLHLSGKISLPNLQILTMYPFALHEEVGYDLPSLRHLSISALSSPRRLLSTHGPSLHSLLLHYRALLQDITSEFWNHYPSLRTLGINPDADRTIVSPPSNHPLRHLCLFLDNYTPERVKMIQDRLAQFPRIRRLSLQMKDITKQEKSVLTQIATQSNLELAFLD